ncbi:MAG: phenylalanine--tRNA ligase subunit beta [Candidatus Pacebacteria bacterium]|nr:phenylalanine--tRNA ligase subunit beta [Candidatus Paceibacterota bacterium]MCF7856993.1 phenylalanine--tRNA ligase subunit beta [Candidatus Paceibacterota bacterium]
MKVVYDWLKEYVGEEIPSVEKLGELFTFHAFEIDGIETISGQSVIDVKVLPDRSSDCLSHRGIAFELGALIKKSLTKDILRGEVSLTPITKKVTVTLESPENCRRFSAALITDVTVKDSPTWLKERLETLGQRSINNVVDATNYVMLALGQPLHAYDAEKFPHQRDVWNFGVRMSHEDEEVTTLSNETYTLTEGGVQLITDAASDTAVGIAGIKGGKYAEIDAKTTAIILEAANFNPQVTRKGAQAIKLQTDASKRFENDISPELIPYALKEITALVLEIAGGTLDGFVDEYPCPVYNPKVTVTLAQINGLLGVNLTPGIVEDIFTRLGFSFIAVDGSWEVVAPFERTDITIPEDLIAEVGRIYGYEHTVSVLPKKQPLTEYNSRHYYSEKIRGILISEGFSEVITSSFRNKDDIELQNALASDKRYLRSQLGNNIREALDRNMPNIDLLGIQCMQVFEIGTVFQRTEDKSDVTEHVSLALGVRLKQQGSSPKDDIRLREVLKKIEEVLGIEVEATVAGGILECDFTKLVSKLPTPTAYDEYVPDNSTLFAAYSTYPFVSRDIALWVPEEIQIEEVESLIKEHAGVLLTRVTLFDQFAKEGKVSYAFRLIFQSFEKTLTDEEVGVIMEKISKEAENRGFVVR